MIRAVLHRHGAFMRMFSSAVISQAVLSAANFAAALLLIRRSSDLQYGYFILVSGVIILAVSLQYSFIAPAMISRMARLTRAQCGDLTGGLYREQRRVLLCIASVTLVVALALWRAHLLDDAIFWLVVAGIFAALCSLRRNYFRSVLLAYRRSHEVLLGDLIYCGLLLCGVLFATLSPMPAAAAILAAGLAALVAGLRNSRTLQRVEAWNADGAPGILREIAPLASWSTAGAGIHWSFSQGYTWLVAATLDVSVVAAVAATRMLAMPVNLLSTGIGSLMLPLTSRWLTEHAAADVLRRLFGFAIGIAFASLCYFSALWLLRDWVFDVVLKKHFAQGNVLLLLWAASFTVSVIHQQLLYLLVARERFRQLTPLALVTAVLALVFCYWGARQWGGAGAVLGILIGELVNTVGMVLLCLREIAPKSRHPLAMFFRPLRLTAKNG